METTNLTFNNDGSIDLPIDGKPVRYVKESDLLAVKGGAESKVKEWENEKTQFQTQLAEANRLRDETHQNLLKVQAEKEQLVQRYNDYDATKTKVGGLEKELGSHKESVGKYEKELTNRIKTNLLSYGAKEDALKDKTLDQLRNLEEAAKLFGDGNKIRPARFDGGTGGASGGSTPESPTDRAKRILEEHEAKKGRPLQVSNIAVK